MKLTNRSALATCLATALTFYAQSAAAEVKIASQEDMQANPQPDGTSMLEIESVTKGILIPRMTEEQRDAIESPADGLIIYNSDAKCINSYHPEGRPAWHDYCLQGQVVVDARMSDAELAETNTQAIKAIEYDKVVTNYKESYDPGTFTFTTPIEGLYSIRATYSQKKCNQEYTVRIGISKPNASPPGDNSAVGAVRWPNKSDTLCSVPLVAEIQDTVPLEVGDTIFIQGRYQQAVYDISGWNYDNEYLNRLLIIYVGGLNNLGN